MHRWVLTLARWMAVLGGLVLLALVLITCVSVAGRILNGWLHSDFLQGLIPGPADWLIGIGVGPLLGDFELVEAGIAFAIFAFLPICQLYAGHATVDIFTSALLTDTFRFPLSALFSIRHALHPLQDLGHHLSPTIVK